MNDTTDPAITCSLCGANPVCLDDTTPEWGALCPYCKYTVNNHGGYYNHP